jgi:curved DNA-binding protein CbpA
MNPFEVLRIPQGSSLEVAKKAYKSLAKIHHPDRPNNHNRYKEAEEEFKRILGAFQSLQEEEEVGRKKKKVKEMHHLTCQYPGCELEFKSTAAKSQHRFVHLPKIACPGCPLKFSRPDSLQRHQTKCRFGFFLLIIIYPN